MNKTSDFGHSFVIRVSAFLFFLVLDTLRPSMRWPQNLQLGACTR
jgi:hypothetical protein